MLLPNPISANGTVQVNCVTVLWSIDYGGIFFRTQLILEIKECCPRCLVAVGNTE